MDTNKKSRVLFVDDDPNILQGLGRMLYPMRRQWELVFSEDGHKALEEMEKDRFDVIVSDMRMPGMDGAALLTEVRKRYPNTSRIALSGHSEKEMIFRAVGAAHQYLSKPCNAETLISTITRTCHLRNLLVDSVAERMVSGMTSIPSLPQLYSRLVEEISRTEPSTTDIAKIISTDIGMSAKILQLVNSEFFGIARNVSSIEQAMSLLGIEVIQGLVLSIDVFSQVDADSFAGKIASALWKHSMTSAIFARQIATAERFDAAVIDECFTSGLLHDVGSLVLAVNMPIDYEKVMLSATEAKITLADAEKLAFGTSHAEIGAFLLGLWGLPDSIIEAVAYHHKPSSCIVRQPGPLLAVHAAHAVERENGYIQCPPDMEYLAELKLESHIKDWQILCDVTLEEGLWEEIMTKYGQK